MKFSSKVSLILLLIFSLVCSPVLAVINRDSPIRNIGKFNLESGIQQNSRQEEILIGQATKKRQGFFKKFNIINFRRRRTQKPRVQQKQKRQGFLSRFRLGQNRNKPKKQKRGFLRRFGIGKT